MWTRWTAPSDQDYEAYGSEGLIERTCQCGAPVWVARDEPYRIHVDCRACIEARDRRLGEGLRQQRGAA